jgi:outer membrane protein OmpA-like peptidoglycan-associated protein
MSMAKSLRGRTAPALLAWVLGVVGLAGCTSSVAEERVAVIADAPRVGAQQGVLSVQDAERLQAFATSPSRHVTLRMVRAGDPQVRVLPVTDKVGQRVDVSAKGRQLAQERPAAVTTQAAASGMKSPASTYVQAGAGSPLTALQAAARLTRDGDLIFLLDSGIAQTPDLPMTQLFQLEPRQAASKAVQTSKLDLSGRSVVVSGLGRTTAPQQPLDEVALAWLLKFWQEVCSQAGGRCEVSSEPRPVMSGGTVRVGLVEPPTVRVEVQPTMARAVVGAAAFSASSAELADDACAKLGQLAGTVLDWSRTGSRADGSPAGSASAGRVRVEVVGFAAAWSTPQERRAISQSRAEQVVACLAGVHGIPRELMSAIGVGSDRDGEQASLNERGEFDEARAAGLRRVEVTATYE